MADIVYLNSSNQNGQRILSALRQVKSALADLEELDGLRANSIGGGAATLAANFGVQDNTQAQIFSDRMSAVVAWLNGDQYWMTTAGDARQALLDLLDATTIAP